MSEPKPHEPVNPQQNTTSEQGVFALLPPDQQNNLDVWIDGYLARTLTPAEAVRLTALLHESANAWEYFRLNVTGHLLLQEVFAQSQERSDVLTAALLDREKIWDDNRSNIDHELSKPYESRVITVPCYIDEPRTRLLSLTSLFRRNQWTGKKKGLLIAAGLLVVFAMFLGVLSLCIHQRSRTSAPVAVARLTNLVDPVWTGEREYFPGQGFIPGQYKLHAGTAQLTFTNGVEMILEAPFEINIRTDMSVYCHSGQMSVAVPAGATGFTVDTPFGEVVDRGTEFFLYVGEMDMNLATRKGKVDLYAGSELIPVLCGMEFKYDGIQVAPLEKSVLHQYITVEDCSARAQKYEEKLQLNKKEADTIADQARDLIARFDVNLLQGKTIPNACQNGHADSAILTMKECSISEGRWRRTKAIQFTGNEIKASFELPGRWKILKMTASVKLDRAGQKGNTILSSNNFLEKTGSFHWLLNSNNELWFHITTAPNEKITFTSPPLFPKGTEGGWFQVTVMVNAETRTVSQFLNGRCVSAEPWPDPVPLVFGETIVGNSGNLDTTIDRHFSGAIDEIKITGTPEE